jgi:hypothetical protein
MRRLTIIAAALALVCGVAGCGGGGENPCDHPNSVKCEEHRRSEEDKALHGEIEEFKHRGAERVESEQKE